MGILASVSPRDDGSHPTLQWLLRCLAVRGVTAYNKLVKDLDSLTEQVQESERSIRRKGLFLAPRTFVTDRYCMFLFRLVDDRGNNLSNYDVIFTAGPQYDENHLAPGFFKDRQRNQRNPGKLTYYIDYDVMSEWLGKPELRASLALESLQDRITGSLTIRQPNIGEHSLS